MSNHRKLSKNQKTRSKQRGQRGGGSSDYVGLFNAQFADPAQLSRFTLKNIDSAPVFHPLETNAIIPTGATGINTTCVGAYFDAIAPLTQQNMIGPPVASYMQAGGAKGEVLYVTKKGKSITNRWIAFVLAYSEKNNIKYTQALKDPNVKQAYYKVYPKK